MASKSDDDDDSTTNQAFMREQRRDLFGNSDDDDSDDESSVHSGIVAEEKEIETKDSRSSSSELEENSKPESDKSGEENEDEHVDEHEKDIQNDRVDSSGEEEETEVKGRPALVEETILNAEIPKINVDLGNHIHFVKFPNFLSVEPRPFDPDTYEDEVDEDDILDEEGRSRLKLKVENTIRWRLGMDEEGNLKRDSNAKIVRWSDGSLSLYLGSEVFDVHTHPLQGDHHHLFVRQGTGLQGRNVFRTKLTFRPHSTDSFTHRKMTMSMADKTNKAQNKVKVLPAVGKNPEAVKQELIKKEEERMRASARRESQQRRMRERTHGIGGGRALSAAYLEPDRDGEDEGGVSLSALKNRYKAGAKDMSMRGRRQFSDEEEEEEEESDVGSDVDSRSGGHHKSSASSSAKQGSTAKRIIDSDEDETSQSPNASKSERSSFDRTETKRRPANVIAESDEDD